MSDSAPIAESAIRPSGIPQPPTQQLGAYVNFLKRKLAAVAAPPVVTVRQYGLRPLRESQQRCMKHASHTHRMQVEYNELTYHVSVPDKSAVQNAAATPTSVTSLGISLMTCKPIRRAIQAASGSTTARSKESKTTKLTVLGGNTGKLHPGTLTLVLAPPGHSKSAFLKALTQQLARARGSYSSGSITYSGMSPEEAVAKGIHVKRLVSLVPQREDEAMFPDLTVRETLTFAAATLRSVCTYCCHPDVVLVSLCCQYSCVCRSQHPVLVQRCWQCTTRRWRR
jgi:hypothetical protein